VRRLLADSRNTLSVKPGNDDREGIA